jgi:GTP pyrophosphokinase
MGRNASTCLGSRFERALVYATRAHEAHSKKGTGVPYVAHLLGVTSLVLEDGGDEDEAIAALLHDVVEDQGGAERLTDVEREFGRRVAAVVEGCSDTVETPKPPWRGRKEAYLLHLETADSSVIKVSLADKLYNARALLLEYREIGESLWARFDPDSDQLWYYRTLTDVYRRRSSSPLVGELERVVAELAELVANSRVTVGGV